MKSTSLYRRPRIETNCDCQKAGIPKTTFNAIMNGKRTLYADDLRAICLALNVSPEMFIDVTEILKKKR